MTNPFIRHPCNSQVDATASGLKSILVTGARSYIGQSFASWVRRWPDRYSVSQLDLRDTPWRQVDFSPYHAVVHLAAIVHQAGKRRTLDEYLAVNHRLALDVARKAKDEHVPQFVLLSSMSVYGRRTGMIDEETTPAPNSPYGLSKYLAELSVSLLADETFQVAVLRPPMVYGPNCRGNYRRLSRLAIRVPTFPSYANQRSMLFVDALSECIRDVIEKGRAGIILPQNAEYVSTTEMVSLIAGLHGHRIKLTPLFDPVIRRSRVPVLESMFGNLTYRQGRNSHYSSLSFEETIRISEGLEQRLGAC